MGGQNSSPCSETRNEFDSQINVSPEVSCHIFCVCSIAFDFPMHQMFVKFIHGTKNINKHLAGIIHLLNSCRHADWCPMKQEVIREMNLLVAYSYYQSDDKKNEWKYVLKDIQALI